MSDELNSDPLKDLTREAFRELIEEANSGDQAALARLRKILDQNPHIWRQVGDLAASAEEALIGAISRGNSMLAESLSLSLHELKQSLTGPCPAPLEQLAAQRVIILWLQVQQADMRCANLEGGTRGWASFWSRAQDRAHKRYGAALRELAMIQRLLERSPFRPTVPLRSAQSTPVAENTSAGSHASAD